MRLSAWVSVGDLIPHKPSFFEKFIIGKFIYQSIFSKKNPSDVLSLLKKSGVDGIELVLSSNTSAKDLEKISKIVKDLNMQIFSVHQPLSKLFNIGILEINNLCRVVKKLSAKVLVIHINVIGKQIFDKKYILNLKALERDYGIKIGIENSPKSVLTILNSYYWKGGKFSQISQNNRLNITFDVTHLAQVGENISDFFQKNKERIVNIHLSDYKKNLKNKVLLMNTDTHLPIGKGELPIKDFIQNLKKNNYNGLITMEINGSMDEICRSARFIKNNF